MTTLWPHFKIETYTGSYGWMYVGTVRAPNASRAKEIARSGILSCMLTEIVRSSRTE